MPVSAHKRPRTNVWVVVDLGNKINIAWSNRYFGKTSERLAEDTQGDVIPADVKAYLATQTSWR